MARPKVEAPDRAALMAQVRDNRLAVRVTPGAAADRVELRDGQLRVSVTAAPEAGKANRAVAALLARALGIPKSSLRLERGETARDKVFAVDP